MQVKKDGKLDSNLIRKKIMVKLSINAIPSFKDFLRRNQVLGMYRSFLREANNLQGGQRDEIKSEIISQFRKSQFEKDKVAIQRYLADGRRYGNNMYFIISIFYIFRIHIKNYFCYLIQNNRQLEQLQSMTLSRKTFHKEDVEKFSQKSITCDENEIQGRVGTEWPWSRKT